MKRISPNHGLIRLCIGLVLIGSIVLAFGYAIAPTIESYINPTYTEAAYKNFETLFNNSQYRQKRPISIVPDEVVFSYAAGAYLRGVDPIYINSEHTPLGKYFIALSIFFLRNDRFVVIPFGILTLVGLWVLARQAMHDWVWALVPVLVFTLEPLFLNQLKIAPLLDIIQLPFIIWAMVAFAFEFKSGRFWKTGLLVGMVMATKTIVPAIMLVAVYVGILILMKKTRQILGLAAWLTLALVPFFASYTKTFLDGYTIGDFYKFQKWIFLYQKSKLLFPFSAWRLVFLNEWQAWWGDMSILRAEDWRITWPIGTTLSLFLFVRNFRSMTAVPIAVMVCMLWAAVYAVFLSLGVISSRFLLPWLPIVYILAVLMIRQWVHDWRIKKRRML